MPSVQTPPFWHGVDAQSTTSTWQVEPVHPVSQAQAKKHGQVLAQDLDACVGQLTKLLTAVSKVVGKTLEEVNQSAVEQLIKRLEKIGEAMEENRQWAVRFGLKLPESLTGGGKKRRRRAPASL